MPIKKIIKEHCSDMRDALSPGRTIYKNFTINALYISKETKDYIQHDDNRKYHSTSDGEDILT